MSDLSSRNVVSMPSLDAVDEDIPVSSEEASGATLSDAGLTTETSFASTMSTDETLEETEPSESFSSVADAFTTNTETYTTTTTVLTTEESFTLSETASVDPNQLLESSEETEQEQEPTGEDVQPVAEATVENEQQNVAEESEAILQHQGESIDEHAEDDPSIAIDQFIKKIADEQLSSKRRELEESSEEEQVDAVEETNQRAEERVQLAEYSARPDDSSLEATLTGNDSRDLETHQQEDVETQQQEEVGNQMAHVETSMDVDASTHTEIQTQQLLETAGETEPERADNEAVEPEQPMETDHAGQEIEQPPEPPYPEQSPAPLSVKIEKETLPDVMLDSSEVSRDPFLIALAQEEIRKLDVLVCGGCHLTFYLIEELQDHKNGRCTDVSSVLPYCESEGKPQVWGFSLWKVRYLRECGDKPPRPWLLYQKWCKLPQQEKSAWITAGQSVQYVSKIGNAKVASLKKRTQSTGKEPQPIEFVDSNKENSDVYDSNIAKKAISKPVRLNNEVTILPSNKTSRPTNSNIAIRTTKNSSQRNEYGVEKILAKRFNPRRKTWEYQIKWENFDSDANTWEPITNLSHCKQMLEQFEEQLKRVKEEKARQAALAAKGRGRPATATKPVPAPQTSDFTPGRPPRSSKQKAIDHLKTWVGQGSDDEESQGTKRGREHDDDDEDYEAFEKKIKLEQESEDDEDYNKHKGKLVVTRKVTSTPGVGKQPQKTHQINIKPSIVGGKNKEEILPSNILIPDANGVVRINQKQLPALSSGVYIMSKTAGIIKLDSTTSKVATSGGQTIVKVAPKIGQTQIKIVKKDGNTTRQIVQVQATDTTSNKPTLKTYQVGHKIVPKLKTPKPHPPKPTPEVVRFDARKPPSPPRQDDSDDGLEPLEFPDEIVVPEPEPENPDFELDPETGKIKGVEYVDKPVVIKEEPGTRPRTTNELENIVKIAAAGITDDDLTNGNDSQDEDPLDISSNKGYKLFMNKTTVAPQAKKPDGSLLNRALTANTQRTPSGLTYQQQRPQPKTVTQRVINQQVSQRQQGSGSGGITTRIVTQSLKPGQPTPIIRKVMTPTPKYRVSSQQQQRTTVGTPGSRIISQQASSFQMRRATDPSKMQVYSTKSSTGTPVGQVGQAIIRKVGYGTQRSGTTPQLVQRTVQQRAPLSPQKLPQTRVVQQQSQRYYPSAVKREHQQPQIVTGRQISAKPKTSINMPSLIGAEDLPATPKLAPKPQPKPVPAPVAVLAVEEPKAEESDTADVATADLSTFTMADSDNPIYITGDDGTVYQVAGQNEQGQTILITQGPDGQQQCLLVTNEVAEGDDAAAAAETEAQSTEANAGVAEETEQHVDADALAAAVAAGEESMMIPLDSSAGTTEATDEMQLQTPLQIKTDMDIEETQLEDGNQDQVVAQVVRAEPPSPGGTHKVVVMLPDGNLMVTQVSPEEYRSLELD